MSFIFLRNRVTGGAAFDPASLFASGEEGAWYEPSPTTAFLSTTDLTPCGVGDSCGFLLDKSQGAGYAGGSFTGLGAEGAVNGDFATDSDWVKGTGWTIAGGKATHATGSTSVLSQTSGFSVGDFVLMEVQVTHRSGTGVIPRVGGTTFPTVNATGTYLFAGAFTTNSSINFTAFSNWDGDIEVVSVKSLPGNHATQTNPDARPFLQQTAGGLYYLEFDGTDDYLIVPSVSIAGAAAFDFYAAWESDDVTATTMLFAALSSATQFARPVYTGSSFFSVRFGAGSSASSVSGAISSATPYVSGSRFTQNTAYSGRLNGVSTGEITSGFGAGALLSGVNPFLGAESNSGSPRFYWNGKLFGAVAIQRNVTSQEISDTETYLAAKSGVTL